MSDTTPSTPRAVSARRRPRSESASAGSAGASLRTSTLLAIALAIVVGNLHNVVGGVLWWFVALAVIVVVLGSAALARAFVRARGWGTVAGIVAGVCAITPLFASDTAVLGVFPTFDSWDRFVDLMAQGRESISAQAVPAEATIGILFLLCWTSGALAVLLDAVAIWWRRPALAGVPLLVVLCVPSIVDPTLTDPFLFALAAIAYLLLLRPPQAHPQTPVAVGLGTFAVVGAVLLPLILPPVTLAPGGPSTGGSLSAGFNPILELGDDLRGNSSARALSYTTTAPDGQYLRLTTLESFRGGEWEPLVVDEQPDNDVARFAAAEGLAADVITETATTAISIDNANGRWLPVPYPATSITGLTGQWYWESEGLAVRSTDANMRGQEYIVDSLDVRPTSTQLEQAPSSESLPEAQVPDGLDPIVGDTADAVIASAGAETDYDAALALQEYFRGGDFVYSEEAPVEEGFDGSGLDVLVPFLDAKAGYCVHFASAMAVMARTQGIPSRVVVGFLPGDAAESDDGLLTYTVSSQDLHAWPELYFAGIGWTRFEPTPGRGTEPNFVPAAVDNPSTPDVDESLVTPTPTPTATATAEALPTPTATADPFGAAASDTAALSGWAPLGAIAAALLLAAPGVARVAIRASRLHAIRRDRRGATAAWVEVVETARDLGLSGGIAATPRDLAARLGTAAALSGEAEAALATLRLAVEREAYAPGGSTRSDSMSDGRPTVAALRSVLRALRAGVHRRARIRAAFLPATITDRVRAALSGGGVQPQ